MTIKATTTHEFYGSNPTLGDLRAFIEKTNHLDSKLRVSITSSDDQRDGNSVRLSIREEL